MVDIYKGFFLKGVPVSIPSWELLKTVAVWGLPSSLQMCYMISAAGALSFTRRIMSVDADKWKGNLWPKNNVTTKVPHIGLPVLANVADSINLLGIVKPLSNPLLRIWTIMFYNSRFMCHDEHHHHRQDPLFISYFYSGPMLTLL